ncbi:MAG: murein transglycosylase A [Bacteroidota bacterium]
MKYSKTALCLCFWLVPLQCTTDQLTPSNPSKQVALDTLSYFEIEISQKKKKKKHNGKLRTAQRLSKSYTKTNLSTLPLPYIDQQLKRALERQLTLLRLRKQDYRQQFGNLELDLTDLETTIELLLTWEGTYPQGIAKHLNAYQLSGKDGRGNVKFTGYFTPEISVSRRKSKRYPYPIYAFPKSLKDSLPTRKAIDGDGVLEGMGLELAYAKRLEDIYYMQLQGSGLVRYRDGNMAYLGYAGTNKHPYESIGRYIQGNELIALRNISMEGVKRYLKNNPEKVKPILFANPSYVFFRKVASEPKGAGHVPLTADYSIAVDINHLPLGSCLLAALPILDEEGIFSHHEYRFLVAQDVGGAIRGNGHVDVYCGVGEEGQRKAMALHHYGQLWLLLPKSLDKLGPVFSEERHRM